MKENNIQAINTFYKGNFFRSRLEARWAIFFDSLGIEWEYEPEGYDLNGIKYLPDFWLPTFDGGMYVEVKPKELNELEFEKACRLATQSGKIVWLAVGVPAARAYTTLQPYKNEIFPCDGIPLIDEAFNKNGMFYSTYMYADSDGVLESENKIPYINDSKCPYNNVLMAVNAARTARFEHGGQ